MEFLTVKVVEELQEAAERKVQLGKVVSTMKGATLPALLEYGCLRWAKSQTIPALPPAVKQTEIGKALLEIRSELGLRSTGPPKQALKRLDTMPVEFHVIEGTSQNQIEEWEQFEIRFDRSVQSVGFSAKTAHALQAAFHEMAENATIHAAASVGILLGYQVRNGVALFSVADVGIGVLASLRSNPAYRNIELHKDAIRAALQDGTSRFGQNTRGLGFRQVFKALAAQWGSLRFRSGSGCVTLSGEGLDVDQGEESFPPFLPGFQVTVACRTTAPVADGPLL